MPDFNFNESEINDWLAWIYIDDTRKMLCEDWLVFKARVARLEADNAALTAQVFNLKAVQMDGPTNWRDARQIQALTADRDHWILVAADLQQERDSARRALEALEAVAFGKAG